MIKLLEKYKKQVVPEMMKKFCYKNIMAVPRIEKIVVDSGFGKKIICFPAGPAVAALRILEILRLSPLYKWIYATAAKDSFVSVEKAEAKLGFRPKYSNRDALIRNYEWYRDNYAGAGGGHETGISHRLPWKQSALKIIKWFF